MALSHHQFHRRAKQTIHWSLIILAMVVTLVFVRIFKTPPGRLASIAEDTRVQSVALKLHSIRIQATLARGAGEQVRGLSGRPALGEFEGLLFLFAQDGRPDFWMKDMNFPIDIIWIDRNLKVVAIDRNVAPDSYPRVFYPPAPIRYVLEVNAGLTDAYNINPGEVIGF